MLLGAVSYLGLVSREPETAASVLADELGLSRQDVDPLGLGRSVPVLTVGRCALILCAPGDPFVAGAERPGVHHVALEVDDLAAAQDRVAAAGLDVATREPVRGLAGARRIALPAEGTAGVRTWLSEPIEIAPARPGPVERLDHVGVASGDNGTGIAAFRDRLGFPLESMQTDVEVSIAVESFTSDRYGVVHHTRPPVPVGGLRVAFVTVGDFELEFLQNLDPHQAGAVLPGTPGDTRQDQGAIARYVAKFGPGLHHIAMKTVDIDGLLNRLERGGHAVIDRVGRPGSRRARIGFMHPKALGGILLHFVQRDA